MKPFKLIIAFIIAVLIAVTGLIAAWRLLGGEERARRATLEFLQESLGETLRIQRLSLNPSYLTAHGFSLDLTPRIEISTQELRLRFSPLRLIGNGFKLKGAIDEVTLISPTVLLLRDTLRTTPQASDSLWRYPPHSLKALAKLDFIRRIDVVGGRVIAGGFDHPLADSIIGSLDLTNSNRVTLNLNGISPFIPFSQLRADGTADLDVGDFVLRLTVALDSLAAIPAAELPSFVKVEGGQGEMSVILKGDENLHLVGKLELRNASAKLAGVFDITEAEVAGDLDAEGADLKGLFRVNGMQVPFSATVVDLPLLRWRIQVDPSLLVLEDFRPGLLRIPAIAGKLGGQIEASGVGSVWGANLDLKSDRLEQGGVVIEDLQVKASAESSLIRLDGISASILGGRIAGSGFYKPEDGSSELALDYRRAASVSEILRVLGRTDIGAVFSIRILGSEGSWNGSGTGAVSDHNGKTLLQGRADLIRDRLVVNLRPVNSSGYLNFTWNLTEPSNSFHVASENPQMVLGCLLKDGQAPLFLTPYQMTLNADGSSEEIALSMDWLSDATEYGGNCEARIRKADDRSWRIEGDLSLNPGAAEQMQGRFEGLLDSLTLSLSRLTLTSGSKKILLDATGSISLTSGKLERCAIRADRLPVTTLVRYVLPQSRWNFDGLLTGSANARRDSIYWDVVLTLIYPDSVSLFGHSTGSWSDSLLHFRRTEISDADENILLTSSGWIDWKDRKFDSLLVRAVNLPVGRLIRMISPNLAGELDGNLNARLEADGAFNRPRLDVDAHLSSGVIGGQGGFWANLRWVTEDSLYRVERFDFGNDVSKLLAAEGQMNRNTGAYRAELEGKGFESGILAGAVTGMRKLMEGKTDLNVRFEGGDRPQRAVALASVTAGRIGPLGFNRATASVRLTGLDADKPELALDSITFDWGGATGFVSGAVGLKGDYPCTVDALAEGNLLAVLPHLTSFFSQPQGSGSLELKFGGSLNQLRLESGRFELRDGSFKMNDVIRRFDNLEVAIATDSTGRIKVERFTGEANGNKFRFGNRFLASGDAAQPIFIGGYSLGIIGFQTEPDGIWVVIPSLMDKSWGGYMAFTGKDGEGDFEFQGPTDRLSGVGEIRLRNATVTFPFLPGSGTPSPFVRSLLNLLERIHWNGRVIPEGNCRYIRELSGLSDIPIIDVIKRRLSNELFDVDIKLYLDLQIEDQPEGLLFTGTVKDTLHVGGTLTSTRGSVEYLDLKFDINQLGVVFSPANPEPMFYGNASTQVLDRDSIPREIRMVLTERKSGNGTGVEQAPPGAVGWSNLNFVLEDDQNHSQEQILALLGYSPENLSQKLPSLSTKLVEEVTPLRRWTRILERQVERFLGLDRFDIEQRVAANLIERQLYPGTVQTTLSDSSFNYLQTLNQSRLTVGKYLTRDLYVSYSGSLMSETAYNVTRLGVVHEWDVLVRMSGVAPGLSLNYRYQYNSLAQEHVGSILLRYSFLFDL